MLDARLAYPPGVSDPVIPIQPDLLRDEDFPVAFGSYRLVSLLGEGGMARVFRADLVGEEGFRKPTAVKVIHAAVAARGEALRRSLINEARTGGLLHHPNIVDTYNYGEVQGLPYIAMEYVRGVTLDRALRRGPLPPELVVQVGAQICAGLDRAHHLEVDGAVVQVVHRDLKPSNIILSRDGMAKVMDFGIAKATTNAYDTTQTGMTKGTPAYMSPEQAAGHELDGRSDLFALGAILYEMATGQRFFEGETLVSLLLKVVQVETMLQEPARMARIDEAVPGLSAIVRGCLRQEVSDRWPDAATVEEQLLALSRALPHGVSLRRFVREIEEDEGADAAATGPTKPWPGTPADAVPATRPMPAAAGLGAHVAARPADARPSGPAVTRLQVETEAPRASEPANATLWRKPRGARADWRPLFAGLGVSLLLASIVLLLLGPRDLLRRGRTGDGGGGVDHTGAAATSAEGTAGATGEGVGDAADEAAVAAAAPAAVAPAAPSNPEPTPAPQEPSTPAASPPPRVEPAPRPVPSGPSIGRDDRRSGSEPLAVRAATVTEAERTADSAVISFEARISGAGPDDEVLVYFNPPKARWVSKPMRNTGGSRWEVNVTFPAKSVSKTYWYVVVTRADGTTATFGTESDPKKARLRW